MPISPSRKISIAVVILLLLLLSGISPVLLDWATLDSRRNWSRISDVSQSYSAAGYLVSTFTLIAVTIALFLQIRQTRVAQLQVTRTLHMQLMNLALEDKDLRQTWGPTTGVTEERRRHLLYINLIFKYLESGYVIGEFSQKTLHRTLANRFRHEIGRMFWLSAHHAYKNDATGRRAREFCKIADREYRNALQAGTEMSAPSTPKLSGEGSKRGQGTLEIVAFVVLGSVIGAIISRWRSRGAG